VVDTEEMYRRGLADAERGDPNPFYYQHYYPYRRGYDQMRRRLHRPNPIPRQFSPLAWLLGAAAIGLIAVVLLGRLPSTALFQAPEPTAAPAAAVPTARPTRTPILPTATPTPTPTPTATPVPPTLHVGGSADVIIDRLRGRHSATTKAQIALTFRKGERVTILEGPVEADGYIWWKLQGASGEGWSAQGSPSGDVWLQPVP
jgi:hypothetical protein